MKARKPGGVRPTVSSAPSTPSVPYPPLAHVSPERLRQINRAHSAAMKLISSRSCPDGELLLSFVIWPTPAIVEALELAASAA